MFANNNKNNRKNIPTIWAFSMNFSLGLRRVITSYNRNITCPPSNAGIGNRFITPRISDNIAVKLQNDGQCQ